MTSLYAVVTTIQNPTPAVRILHNRLTDVDGRLIVAGDVKGPASWTLPGSVFLSFSDQLSSGFSLAEKLPTGHYARKNIAYLTAVREGASVLYETDDDNAPLDIWKPRTCEVPVLRGLNPAVHEWVNVYRAFTDDPSIWPRGFPLDKIGASSEMSFYELDGSRHAPVQQGLVNGSADVDAVWRLTQDRAVEFDPNLPVWLGNGQWCPFNTQSTWWWPEAFPLLYVPSFCSFRMCDIWKSFVAQRCLWAMGFGLVFHAPEVFQERNEHNLMKDFEDEVPGYLHNTHIAEALDDLSLTGSPADDLMTCYEALVKTGHVPDKELALVDSWCRDLEGIHG